MTQKFIILHKGIIRKQDRKTLNSHKSAILWFTGLSCAGKSTLAYEIEEELFKRGLRAYVLDGDNVRTGLNKDLYEEPEHPEIVVETDKMTVEKSVEKIMNYLEEKGYINKWKRESTLKKALDIK
ncbi:MAG TPA: adenylyl-sulfate kinase [Candidatus Atribacteria bacterium]|nr:adenylyl-sulfate kinase [Candidatus Atribacteria bacterium]